MNATLIVISIFVNLCGFLSLLIIWREVQKRISPDDYGYFYMALGMGVWVIYPIYLLLFSNKLVYLVEWPFIYIPSILNNGFFLYSIFFFEHPLRKNKIKIFNYEIFKSLKAWKSIVFIMCFLTLLSTIIFSIFGNEILTTIPDLVLSSITTVSVGLTFYYSFQERELIKLARFSAMVMILVLLNLFVITFFIKDEESTLLLIMGAHIGFIFISLACVVGWVFDRDPIRDINRMKLEFLPIESKNSLGVIISIDETFDKMHVYFSPTLYLYLLKFAVRKHCRNSGLSEKEGYHGNTPMRINEVIRKARDLSNNNGLHHKNEAPMRLWPRIFKKKDDGHELDFLPQNIIFSNDLIPTQINKILGKSKLQNASRDVSFVVNEYQACLNSKESN